MPTFVLLMFGLSGVSGALSDKADPFDAFTDARLLKAGDIVAQGTPNEEGCHFDGFGVSITGTGVNEGYILDMRTDDACNMVVQESRPGTVSTEGGSGETVSDLNPPPRPDGLGSLIPVPIASASAASTGGAQVQYSGGGGTSYPSGQKEVRNYIWMYGYGGPDDRLTIKEGRLTFSYERNIAWMTSHTGYCKTWESWWKVDECYLNGSGTDPNHVWRKATGKYHCNPPSNWPCNMSSPDGYYHSLIGQENGYANGSYRCDAWYSGNIVAGSMYACEAY